MVLIGLGLVAATSLVFLEVGLSEDRERARERKAQRPAGVRRAPPQGLGAARPQTARTEPWPAAPSQVNVAGQQRIGFVNRDSQCRRRPTWT